MIRNDGRYLKPTGTEWLDKTCTIIAGGPSLAHWQLDIIEQFAERHKVITINNSVLKYPTADIAYACDAKWWGKHFDQVKRVFEGGHMVSLEPTKYPEVLQIGNSHIDEGIDPRPDYVRLGKNSTYQAMDMAIGLGCKRIAFVGLDLKLAKDGKVHHWGDHVRGLNNSPPLQLFIKYFNMVAPELLKLGVDVYNCSVDTALNCFPKADIWEILSGT